MSAIEISDAIKHKILSDIGEVFCLFDKVVIKDDMVFDYAQCKEGGIRAEFYIKDIKSLNKIHFVEAVDFCEVERGLEFRMLKKKDGENVRFYYNNIQ